MNTADAIAHVLKREGVEMLFAYPANPLIEACAEADMRTVICRQERIGLHMADAYSRLSSGKKIGVFSMRHGSRLGKRFRRRRASLRRVVADPGAASGI